MSSKEKEAPLYIGVDGEGQGRLDHKYVYLAASTEDGSRSWSIESPNWESSWNPATRSYREELLQGLSTKGCLDFLLSLPKRGKCFAYAFNYDETKILTDLDNEDLYNLFRPERRPAQGKGKGNGPTPIQYTIERRIGPKLKRQVYSVNLQGTKFTIQKAKRKLILWDIFKFYQGKFVAACESWRVGTKEERDAMSVMKDKRGEFDKESPGDVREYCLDETRKMAELARKLIEAHETVDLPLKSFYGAGSSASAMLLKMGIKEKIGKVPIEMMYAVACAFFGGRFENSVVGAFRQRVYNYDISSAYPYQLCFLPCLLHGTWERTTDRRRLEKCKTALVRYKLGISPRTDSINWGPFPFRTKEGSICFPLESGGGWVWRDEYLVGERLWKNTQFVEAWVYSYDCECRPFVEIPNYYLERIRLGKEAAGIVLKLGMNSCYGKLAQSIGNAMFNSWAWSGMITSGCRAQLLELFGLHKDWSNILMLATDGLGTLEQIKCPYPMETGTALAIDDKGKHVKKPLGGWEEKINEKGLFLARPGIYFPMNPTEDELGAVRARGVGRGVVYKQWKLIVDTWEKQGMDGTIRVNDVARFCGAKTSISMSGPKKKPVFTRSVGMDGPTSPSYGQWIVRNVDMSFDPLPKRERLMADGKTLEVRRMPLDLESVAYSKVIDKEGMQIKMAVQEALEQPDVELQDYAFENGLEGLE